MSLKQVATDPERREISSTDYEFEAVIIFQSVATTTRPRFTINGPAGVVEVTAVAA